METSPSQSSGQGGSEWWSAQTGHPTAVTDGFHQGAHGLTGEMYMGTAAKGADIYLPAASLPGHKEKEAMIESLVKRATEWSFLYEKLLLTISCIPCTHLWSLENALWEGDLIVSVISSQRHVFLQHASQLPIAALIQ